jgi:hypothetical protein
MNSRPADPSKPGSNNAFTLIELLVVIAIMRSWLACCRGASAKAKASRTLCASNCKQWGSPWRCTAAITRELPITPAAIT